MELIFIGLDKPDDDILLNEQKFLEKYTTEKLLFENKYINDWNFFNLLNFIFQTEVKLENIKESGSRKLINLSQYKGQHLHPDLLENKYFEWLNISRNDNTMNEYGSLICVLGYLESNKKKNELYLIVE
ncbi:Uncharacterised protein [Chryseobacterium gleum]|uniref:Uncharacterized protein n=2 Tax=Chryseobacterium gleum TaxID=250 RepID=A0A448B0M8_CHRGE|nr:hypothetical protein [Chryseobacterium gleum]EFK33711.1 hypothetical protein HMPREF0204_12780 [Chryseobacterium gleum ATCC 35910]QQY34467.1 hypothetical protein I6I60_12125 [Chryseobacterium gleum]VEE06507.1 Uncharacterised protein [Chryseobacterium gleum]